MTSTYKESESATVNLYQAASAADIPRAKEAIKRRANINAVDSSMHRLTPLLAAILRSDVLELTSTGKAKGSSKMLEMIEFLIKNGADLSIKSSEGKGFEHYLKKLDLKRKIKKETKVEELPKETLTLSLPDVSERLVD